MVHDSTEAPPPTRLAIVGGGIVGLVLTVGLLKRNIAIKVYEQSRGFREIGAGIAFTSNSIRCMGLIDPSIPQALRGSGSIPTSGSLEDSNDYLRWIDGYTQATDSDEMSQRFLYKICAGIRGFEGSRRDQFLEALERLIPPGVIHFNHRLVDISEASTKDPVLLTFENGATVQADAVVGCDGVKSSVRRIMHGQENPVSYPHYSHKYAFRGLVQMDQAVCALGEYKAKNQHMHVGPGAHLIHYPVANNTMLNVAAFVHDPADWPDDTQLVAPATREDVQKVYRNWAPCLRRLVSLLPESIDKWALYDTWDYPAPYFNRGRICLVGDAAHASTPHHGAGACMGIEDVLCLVHLLTAAEKAVCRDETSKSRAITAAFDTFNIIRRPRTQWLVDSSRRVCELYQQQEWAHVKQRIKAQVCFEEIRDRSLKIWHFDYMKMLEEADTAYQLRLQAGGYISGQCASGSVQT